ncbi:MAG: aminotransferase class I/II-fold pyridoxal phosphate-dependent enzyme [Candidatus Kapaibacterium sp.]|nr:MAG: aminotransferase class I/II-fold pyridoxal phosphate-dependent enzyme [Candidatus Kapabacteria bacterium]
MFQEIEFNRIKRLPPYIFAHINDLKMKARYAGHDVIDLSMGNPDGDTPAAIVEKAVEVLQRPKTHRYSASRGIPKLREAISKWYERRYGVYINPETEAISAIGSKDAYAHFMLAAVDPGDLVVVPDPSYPIHTYGVVIAGGNVNRVKLSPDEDFFTNLSKAIKEAIPKPKFVVVNFPNNPTTITAELDFYKELVALARKERFYIVSDIAYADICFNGYKTPSIMQIEGAKDVAVETFTMSKSYNMAGWRMGFMVGNERLVGVLAKIKSYYDYGVHTALQVAAIEALNNHDDDVEKIRQTYEKRMKVLVESFNRAGWAMEEPKASMFVWAKIPEPFRAMGSLEFAKKLINDAHIAVSPGIGFGPYGDEYVRIAFIENEHRIRQAAQNIKEFFRKEGYMPKAQASV